MCTAIFLYNRDSIVVANNQDIFLENVMLFTNKRGVRKQALIIPPEEPLKWVSKHGSISFSQCSKEFPSGGMNEVGLVVVQMTLMETVYPSIDNRPAIKEMQFIQYLLDTCSSVEEVIEAVNRVRISQTTWTIHLMVCDSNRDTAIVEFLNGKEVVIKNEEINIKVLSNSTYKDSLGYIDNPDYSVEEIGDPYKKNSIERFIEAKDCFINSPSKGNLVKYGFESLKRVSREDTTWSLVYDIKEKKIYFHTKSSPTIKYISLDEVEFGSTSTSKVIKLSTDIEGSVIDYLKDYNSQINKELVYSFFRNDILVNIMGMDIPDEILNYLAVYPEKQIHA